MNVMTIWEWVTTTTTVDSLFTTLGIGTLAFLFARDLIITKGQHLRRIQDIVNHHDREREEKDARAADLRESRDGWKEAARVERERADKATASVGEMASTLDGIHHVLASLDLALPKPGGIGHE